MTSGQQLFSIAMVMLATVATRFLPFLVFPAGNRTPAYIRYLGKVLPSATLGLLLIFCYRNAALFTGVRGLPQLLAGAAVAALHLWKRRVLLSVAGGTILYTLLLRVFG